jgi:hypothetical protein
VEGALGRILTAEELEEASSAKGWERVSELAPVGAGAATDGAKEEAEG